MNDERDDLWDPDKLIPEKKLKRVTPIRISEEAIDISFGDETPDESFGIPKRTVIRQIKLCGPELEYCPENSLILKVKIRPWHEKYDYYDRFIYDAEKYYRARCEKVPFVPYFSYLPQYNQMNIDQLRYYIYWRGEVAAGRYPQTDYSYIFLFLYELINSERLSTPEKRLAAMCSVLTGYHGRFARLDRYAGEWICDFCLIHQLPPPLELLSEVFQDVLTVVSLREFYINDRDNIHDAALYDFIVRNNAYDYTRSAAYNETVKPLYDAHIINAVVYAIEKTENIKDGTPLLIKTRVIRDSYSGALCVSSAKKKIEVEYLSLNRSYRFRGMITDLVKCAENHLRMAMGARGRLSVKGLSDEAEAAVAEYFEKNIVRVQKKRKVYIKKGTENIQHELYESVDTGFDLAAAENIEKNSWDLTKKLVGEEASDHVSDVMKAPPAPEGYEGEKETAAGAGGAFETLCVSLTPLELKFLRLVSKGDKDEIKKFCTASAMLPDAAAGEINELAYELTGDVILEGLELVEDYADDVRAALSKMN